MVLGKFHGSVIDITGKKFGKLTVTKFSHKQGPVYFWECLCDCGKTVIVRGLKLKGGNTKSCGCSRYKYKYDQGETGFQELLISYKKSCAEKRGFKFLLTEEEFKYLTKQNCYYCGSEPQMKIGPIRSKYVYNGVDRIDNNKDYCRGNVVPCCGKCNRTKGSTSREDFLNWVKRVYLHTQRQKFSLCPSQGLVGDYFFKSPCDLYLESIQSD